jgi:hypothetical protein
MELPSEELILFIVCGSQPHVIIHLIIVEETDFDLRSPLILIEDFKDWKLKFY